MSRTGDIIFSSNKVWNLMYFDDFQIHQFYQLSYLESADRPYYNCAHVDENLSSKNIHEIEKFFRERNLPSRIYSHSSADVQLIEQLKDQGYSELPDEEEIWYEYDLSIDPVNWEQYCKIDPSKIIFKEIDPASKDLEAFMKLNGIQNQMPENICSKFVQNIRKRLSGNIENHYFIGLIDGCAATIGTKADVGTNSFFSEGATCSNFPRMGLYSTLLSYRLLLARKQGLKYAYVRCDKEAFSNQGCQKVGFKKIFTRTLWERK